MVGADDLFLRRLRREAHDASPGAAVVGTETCYYVDCSAPLRPDQLQTLRWLLGETFDREGLQERSFLDGSPTVIEIGPRLNFETAWSSTAVTVCHDNGIPNIDRIERSLRIALDRLLTHDELHKLSLVIHDRMTETVYAEPLTSFETGMKPSPVRRIPLLAGGIEALRRANVELGLAMDEEDLTRFVDLFVNRLGRDPTDVELFQLGQGNSEHSRHGFFKGRLFLDGHPLGTSLMDIVKAPWRARPQNSLIAFKDDSSGILGRRITAFAPVRAGVSGPMATSSLLYHPTITAETHNFPSGVAPYPGGATGTGGRIRDNQCVGRSGLVLASGTGYCVGTLYHPELALPWRPDMASVASLASPVDILLQASSGASDYGNCFGEPLILGFVRMFGGQMPDGYGAWLKPVMYTVGTGQVDDRHVGKDSPTAGMLVAQVGGPAYRIGIGGGAASSMHAGENASDLDFNAVQRGNPEMEQRLNRVFRACVELGDDNPIRSAHDLGAGGDSNALPELVDPVGARVELRAIPVGDATLSTLEIWANESQERNAVLVRPGDVAVLEEICRREGAPLAIVGRVTGDGQLVVHDEADDSSPVDLPLKSVLDQPEPKAVRLESVTRRCPPLSLPDLAVDDALRNVLLLPSVGSKGYLTRKVDRSITGQIAQQQCVGPHHLPLADYAVVAQSLFDSTGVALSLGEQPIKGLTAPDAMARLAVAEAVLNMSGAKITALEDVKCQVNWMWAAKLPGEGARLYQAACALRDIMLALGIAADGGKDSLSMAVRDASGEVIKAPGTVVVAAYAPLDDVTRRVTPDIKLEGNHLLLIDLSGGKRRLGGSALAQAYGQLGDDCPDVDDISLLRSGFETVQELVDRQLIVSAHDRSDGGLIVALVEMSFGGCRGLHIDVDDADDALSVLFSEELGVVVECAPADESEVMGVAARHGAPCSRIGRVGPKGGEVVVNHDRRRVLSCPLTELRAQWEHTSSELEKLQANPEVVEAERGVSSTLTTDPPWHITFRPMKPTAERPAAPPRLAVVREHGTNGDREMAAAFHLAGFEVWDVTMSDLSAGRVTLDGFRGVAFPGGFSFGDVFDSGKGWAGKIRFHPSLARQFSDFYTRPDTFSLGVCNGCQLMALLGWVPGPDIEEHRRPRFIRNVSGRFESRFVSVAVLPSPAIMLEGMAGSVLGVWVAHGEGYAHGVTSLEPTLAPVRFVDPDGEPTEQYPFNPNGSPGGITAVCSADGRHLAMMPHPERLAVQLWQWPWMPPEWEALDATPWLRIFQNAYDWCRSTA